MDETRAKQLLAEMLSDFTPGSILHLLGNVLRENAPDNMDETARQQLASAEEALFVVGVGLDAVCPR
ncbi:MAG: hypothetical protein K8U57_33750 [Planctomycetes bacterium]|nr:hypothetical protein [Planctomycetota bacterium]